MNHSISGKVKLGGLALVAAASVAMASVTFDFGTGVGFVGKGDIQNAFGLNNPQVQQALSSCASDPSSCPLSFSHTATDVYEAVCTFITAEGKPGQKTHNITIPRHTNINAAIAFDTRKHSQIDGFNLTGNGDTTHGGDVPVVGQACVPDSGGQNGVWTSVTLISSSGDSLNACMTTVTISGKGKNTTTTITESCVSIYTLVPAV
jgi:hypothetical protein